MIDLSECIECEACLEIRRDVFRRSEAGFIEVVELSEYHEEEAEEAIKNCPADCIAWEEV